MYNVGDLISRYVPVVDMLRLESRVGIMVASLLRYLLIPAFYFTANYGTQGWMLFLCIILGVTNGYLTVCILMTAPKGYKVCAFLSLSLSVSPSLSIFIYACIHTCACV